MTEVARLKLEEVFKLNGIPTHTFVRPSEYDRLLVGVRTPGRGVVVEGPSGIGKTSAVEKVLEELGLSKKVVKLSARKKQDLDYIESLPDLGKVGTVVVDDFHKLSETHQRRLADYLKTLADEESTDAKLVILGINQAGQALVEFASDLVNRIEVIRFESNPPEKIRELIEKGEKALNIKINVKEEIIRASRGSFYLAQMLSHQVCGRSKIFESQTVAKQTAESLETVKAEVWSRLKLKYERRCQAFCEGNKFIPEGRAPYLHLLHWLATEGDWFISIRDAVRKHPEMKGSVVQVAEKGHLKALIEGDPDIAEVLNFDTKSLNLAAEDPQFVFFIRGIPWKTFASNLGYLAVEFKNQYDFALSFAGSDRDVAEEFTKQLEERSIHVFYDKNEQHRIAGSDIEEYLLPIYQSEAQYVVCLLGPDYPKRVWTKIESDAFRARLKTGAVIPIWFDTAPPGVFDDSRKIGGFELSRTKSVKDQVAEIISQLCKKLAEARQEFAKTK